MHKNSTFYEFPNFVKLIDISIHTTTVFVVIFFPSFEAILS